MRRLFVVMVLLLVASALVALAAAPGPEAPQPPMAAEWTATGELQRPTNYRQWIFIGAPVTPNDMNDGHAAFPEFHDVYIDRTAFAAYMKTGEFPKGTVIVKELVSVGGKHAASGNGYFPGKFNGLAAAVKDTAKFGGTRYGWGYFDFGAAKKTAAVGPAQSCNACHKASAAKDMVFTQYYPVLGPGK